jgi:hypothetical protein
MTTPKQPEPAVMTLEETMAGLSLRHRLLSRASTRANVSVAKLMAAALHHLEAGKRECSCESMKEAICEGSGVWNQSGLLKVGLGLPPITFCPWCGGKLSTQTTDSQG